jgi:hypothetical protein
MTWITRAAGMARMTKGDRLQKVESSVDFMFVGWLCLTPTREKQWCDEIIEGREKSEHYPLSTSTCDKTADESQPVESSVFTRVLDKAS